MNVMGFLTGLFRGNNMDGHVGTIRERARQDAQATVGEYMREFEGEAARILLEGQQRLLGAPVVDQREEDVIEGEQVTMPDYRSWTKADLMRCANERGLETPRNDRKDDLAKKLEESDLTQADT